MEAVPCLAPNRKTKDLNICIRNRTSFVFHFFAAADADGQRLLRLYIIVSVLCIIRVLYSFKIYSWDRDMKERKALVTSFVPVNPDSEAARDIICHHRYIIRAARRYMFVDDDWLTLELGGVRLFWGVFDPLQLRVSLLLGLSSFSRNIHRHTQQYIYTTWRIYCCWRSRSSSYGWLMWPEIDTQNEEEEEEQEQEMSIYASYLSDA